MTHETALFALAVDEINGAVFHAVGLHVLVLRLSEGSDLPFERHLARLDIVETLDDVHLSLAVEHYGTVLVTADEFNLEGQFFLLYDGAFLSVKQCHSFLAEENKLTASLVHLLELRNVDLNHLHSFIAVDDDQVP